MFYLLLVWIKPTLNPIKTNYVRTPKKLRNEPHPKAQFFIIKVS